MRKLIYAVLILFVTGLAQAQNSAINKAETLQKDGDIAGAKELIDAAMVNPKTKNKAKANYIRGLIYESIATSRDDEIASLDPDALNKALESYNEILNTTSESSTYYFFTQQRIDGMWANSLNDGAAKFQEDLLDEAYQNFLVCQQIKPNDTTAYYYAGVAAQQNAKYDSALTNYYKLLELGSKGEAVYGSIVSIERYFKKDNDKALEMVREAIEEHPESNDLKKEEINLLITMNKLDDAMAKLEATLEDDPDNPVSYYTLAYMYDESQNLEKAIEFYNKAIELNPDYFEANFNLAVLYYNKGANLFKEANNLSIKEYQERGEEIIERGRAEFRLSLPYWEQAASIKSEDVSTLQNLQSVYIRLKMMDKANDIKARIDALESN